MRMMRQCVCTLCIRVGHVKQVSEIVCCWFSGSPKNSTELQLYVLLLNFSCSLLALLASTVD